jgi:CRP/FNR family cyclic AMP-dependent transcriptional regulator
MTMKETPRLSEAQRLARVKQTLSQVHHFADLPEAVQEAMACEAAPCHFESDEIICLEGEPAEVFYILEKGWVKATRMSPEGREQALWFLESGEAFGDVALLTDTPSPGTVVALEPVEAWAIEKLIFLGLIKRYPELAMAMIRRLGDRVLYFIGLVEDLSLRSVEARLAKTLLKHADVIGDRLVVPRRTWTTFDEMATRLGTVRDVLSRALKTLEDEQLLHVERHEIIILDPAGLAARGES